MDPSIARLNITHFKRLLSEETDEKRRALLMRLLAEEEAKLDCNNSRLDDPGEADQRKP
jgi:hypothetical protein